MDQFDAIVVGAGPAGCAAAYTMARQGLNVLVVERGQYPGAKNMWGGVYSGPLVHDLFPDFQEDAPIERFVGRHVISFLTDEDVLSVDFRSGPSETASHRGFIALRARFDRWLAGKVEQAGAIVATGLTVTDLIMEGSVVRGVKVDKEEFFGDIVILAEGVNSLLSLKKGLRKEYSPHDMKLGVKEVINLPREVIEERFHLRGNDGVAMEFIGACTRGLPGGGFLYTNRDSLSLGVVVQLSELLKSRVKASDLLEDFKMHPFVQRLIEHGETVEYSAHLIPVSGLKMVPPLFSGGFLVAGDAAALVLGTGLILEGANFAMASGIAAGETAIRAHAAGDFSKSSLQYYERLLKERFVLKDLHTFKKAPEFLENKRIYQDYPALACELAGKIFNNNGNSRTNTFKVLKEAIKEKVSCWQLTSDFMKARKAL
jgi:electron transfer flavoprotein-quinone oxidoreductase